MKCRICDSPRLHKFLDLGNHPPSDQFRHERQLNEPVVYYPLNVHVCEDCGFAQLGHVVPPEILYQDNYPYESSTTETGKRHFERFAKSVVDEFRLGKGELAVDIGSNVGVLLDGFRLCGMDIMGVDPAANICEIARARGIPTLNDFFADAAAERILAEKGPASVITATNVFAHVDDLRSFTAAVRKLLHPKRGVFVIEAPHLLHLIGNLEYDTIYHEHLSYLSIEPLLPFFGSLGMEIIRVEQKDIHGGSIRIFVANQGAFVPDESVSSIVQLEREARLRDPATLAEFARRVERNKAELNFLLNKLKHEGRRIVAVSAPAKGITLLNYCHIDGQLLDYVTEKSRLKIGLYTPGAQIRVEPDARLLVDRPDYALLLAWNFAAEIMKNNQAYRDAGGKFIIPIPSPQIV